MASGRSNKTNYILFFLTILTTIWSGAILFGGNLIAGGFFSFTILTILLTHEMGHWINAQRHGMDVTLPYFIPIPIGLGTLGAFIKMRSRVHNRNVLIDVGAAGPLYGLIAAIIAVAIGMYIAPVIGTKQTIWGGYTLGNSCLFYSMAYLIKGVSPVYLKLNPVLFAGWIGLLVTMLNLLPIGQLDGGHIIYALFGRSRKYNQGVKVFFISFIIWGIFCNQMYHSPTWLVFGVLVFFLSSGMLHHPPLDNELIDLTEWNKIKGGICLIIFAITFLPAPFLMA